MSAEESSRSYSLPRRSRSGVALGFSLPQVVMALVVILVAIGATVAKVSLVVTVPLVLFGLLVALGRLEGDPVVAWIAWGLGAARRRVTGEHEWLSPVPVASALVSAAGEVENVGVAAQVGLPPCLAGIGVVDVEGPGGTFGAVTGPGGTLTAVLTVAGREFALVDAVTKDRLLDGWGGVMSVFSTRRVVTQVAWTAVGTPSGMGEHLAWADAQGEGAERSGAAWQAYGELVASVSGRVAEHTVLLSVTVSRARLVHRRRPSGETGEERLASALREAVNTARNQLMAAGLAVTVPMTAAQIVY